jgi:hypothetical protein
MPSQVSFPGFNADNCTPLNFQVDGSTGCSLTRADIRPFTKADFAAQEFKEVGMDRIIAQTKEARLMGVPQRSLMDLLLSRHVPLRQGSVGPNPSIIAPFRLVPRRHVVNINYFVITAGSATAPVDPVTPFPSSLPATAWYLTVKASTGGFGTAIKNIEKYLLPGLYLYCETTARHVGADWQTFVGGGNIDSSVSLQFRVVGAVGKSGDDTTAYVIVAPTAFQSYEASLSAWTTLKANNGDGGGGVPSSQQKTSRTFVEKGTLLIMANSVSDKEAWCYQSPAINNLGLIEYWQQTYRWTHQYNDEYLKALEAPLTSEFFKKFRTLPIAEQRRQQEALMQKWYFNTFFYGDRISDKQTLSDWTNLPTVDDVTNPGCPLEYKSNTLGARTQLSECGKVLDMNGAALNIDTIREICYNLKRERGNDGSDISVIDTMCDRFTKSKIRDVMIRYYKAKYGVDVNINMQLNQKLVDSMTKRLVFEYDQFDLPDEGVSMSVFTDTYFDDRIGAAQALGASSGTKNRARQLWMLDWSDILIGVIRSRSVSRTTNLADDLYSCVIDPNVNHYKLNSRTIEVQVGNPNRHTVIENFSDACPSMTVAVCQPTIS